LLQALGRASIVELAREFQQQSAKVGGDLAKVDEITSKFEMVTTTETYSYSCGSTNAPATCTGTRTVTKEICTTQMVGRAFSTEAR
jgi:hypothetical protein